MRKGIKKIMGARTLSLFLLSVIFSIYAADSELSPETRLPKRNDGTAKRDKLQITQKLLRNEKTRKQGIKQLSSIAKYAKRKKHDKKFKTGCEALAILSRISRNACCYEFIPANSFKRIAKNSNKALQAKSLKSFEQKLAPFGEYSIVGDWEYDRTSPVLYSNPQLAVFLELAYYKAIDREQSGNLKQALKMLTYAESRTEGIDKAETLCQWGELLREQKEFGRSETYLKNALAYGNEWFRETRVSKNSDKQIIIPGGVKWQALGKRIEDLLFLLSFDLLEGTYGEAYALYVKMRAFYDKEEWWLAFPIAIKLKNEYPDTVYGEYARLAWCRMLLGNDKAEEMRDKSLPSGVKELEKFIAETPGGLYRGEALIALGEFYLEYKWDSRRASGYYKKALEWFRAVREQKDTIDLYALPEKVKDIAAPRGKLSSLDEWRGVKLRKIDPKEIINHKTAPEWYISENEKNCLFLAGFFCFMEGKFGEAKKYFEQVKDVDSNVAKLVGLHWPNVYWRLISACNVKRMIFPANDKKYLKGKNKLRVALAELNYICERFPKAKALCRDMLDDSKSSDAEQAIACIGIAKALDMMPNCKRETKKTMIEYYGNAIKLAKKANVAATANFYMGYLYLTVGWKGRYRKALGCFEKYLKQCPEGEFSKEAQFKQMTTYINLGRGSKAYALFKKYKYEEKYPKSGFTGELLGRFKELNIKKR